MRRSGSWLAAFAASAVFALAVACDEAPQQAPASAPAAADIDRMTPQDVLRGYLAALLVADCPVGRAFVAPTFVKGNGELCGNVRVRSARIDGAPAVPSETEQVFGTTLVTDGSSDGSIPAGNITWFYDLIRQPNGGWRIAGAGSGP